MEKRYTRKQIRQQWRDGILPSVMKELNLISNNLKVIKMIVNDEDFAEVTLIDEWNNHKRHKVDLKNLKCSRREW
jgi:hypothetical protein